MSIASSALARPRRGRLYIIIGAVLAVLAFGAAALIASLPLLGSSTGGTKVVVASHDIKARTLIQASDLTLSTFNPAPPGSFLAVSQVSGKAARVDIPTGEQVGVGGYVQPSDRIIVLASINTSVFGQSPGVGSVRTVFRDIEVLR